MSVVLRIQPVVARSTGGDTGRIGAIRLSIDGSVGGGEAVGGQPHSGGVRPRS
ncbi:hypothetical protein OG874_07335 [Nocardia sp. NBC_00565]|uniref:hypothetical protein n=1 Tax=Nocardia sp. NBC_00565 TaxID=2975993 RepID=UPI002E823011|nr:hypothetical protein [Nocardia sp. NBC_00565]WUC04961.1 hypothetical protein OG874_07335 [Nocardia sp. NBC_00565]